MQPGSDCCHLRLRDSWQNVWGRGLVGRDDIGGKKAVEAAGYACPCKDTCVPQASE